MGSDLFKNECSKSNINMDFGEMTKWKEGIIIRGEL